MNKITKYFSYFVLVIIVFGVLVLAVSQTAMFKTWLKKQVIAIAAANLNGSLEIKKLAGNLYGTIRCEGVILKKKNQPILTVEQIFIQYNPFALFTKKFKVQQIILKKPELFLAQSDSAGWNVSTLFKSYQTDSQAVSSQFDWEISAPFVQISQGLIEIHAQPSPTWRWPERVRDLNVKLAFYHQPHQMKLTLENLTFATQNPDLVVKTIRSKFNLAGENFQVQDLQLQTESSNLSSHLNVKNFKNPELEVALKGQPLSLSEIRRAVPVLKLFGAPRFDLQARGPLNDLEILGNLWIDSGQIQFRGRLQVKEEPFGYELQGETSGLNVAAITGQPDWQSDLNLRFQVSGTGLDWGEIFSRVVVDVDSSRVREKQIQPSHLFCEIKGDSIFYDAAIAAEGAHAQMSGEMLYNERQFDYVVHSKVANLDFGRLLEQTDFTSELNLQFELNGRGMAYENISGMLKMRVLPSHFNRIPIDSARFDCDFKNRTLNLRELKISSPLGKFTAVGDLAIHQENHLKFTANFIDFSVLTKAFPMDSLAGKGQISGRFEGPLDSLSTVVNVKLAQISAADLSIEQFTGRFSGLHTLGRHSGKLYGLAQGMQWSGIDKIQSDFNGEFADSVLHFTVNLQQDTVLSVESAGELNLRPSNYRVALERFKFKYLDYLWEKSRDRALILFTDHGFEVTRFELQSDDQALTVFGVGDFNQKNHLRVQLKNLDIAKYQNFLTTEIPLAGKFNLDVLLTESLAAPVITGNMRVNKGQYLKFPFEQMRGNFELKEGQLHWRGVLSEVANDSLFETTGFLPVKLRLKPFEFEFSEDEQMDFRANSRGLDLSFLNAFTKAVTNIKGTMVANVRLHNTLNDLRGVGPIRIVEGEFNIPELGTKYRKVNLAVILNDKDLIIRDLRMKSGGGKVEIIEGGLSLAEKNLENFNAEFKADNFELMNNKKMQAKVKGGIKLTGSVQSPFFSGDLTVSESRVFYPAWFEDEAVVELTSRPFFIIDPDTVELDTTGAIGFKRSYEAVQSDFTETAFYKNLRGELSLHFPRNTWIRSGDTNIEVEGDLVMVKEGEDFVLFGSFSVIRGYYELLGNRFQIKRGELVFNGEVEPNPEINIEAVYDFKDVTGEDPEKHEFRVLITGTFYSPEFQFTLDEQVAEQQDILSILVFGQSYDNLSIGQRNDVSDESGLQDKATGILTGQVLKKISGKLSEELRLDVIQIESGKNLEEARLRVGKYLTPDVFVSLSQDFGAEGNQKVELEYEIPRKILFFNLLLQASKERQGATGLDLIWKIEW